MIIASTVFKDSLTLVKLNVSISINILNEKQIKPASEKFKNPSHQNSETFL